MTEQELDLPITKDWLLSLNIGWEQRYPGCMVLDILRGLLLKWFVLSVIDNSDSWMNIQGIDHPKIKTRRHVIHLLKGLGVLDENYSPVS